MTTPACAGVVILKGLANQIAPLACSVPRFASSIAEDERLTAQHLIYAASALRKAARTNEKNAVELTFLSSPDAFEREAQVRDGLGVKFEDIAGAVWLGRFHVDLQRSR
jgi:hypothetical protein